MIKSEIVSKKDLIVDTSSVKVFLKTKIKSVGDEAPTKFRDKEMPNADSNYLCLTVISSNFVLNPFQDRGAKKVPYHFFPCNFYKRKNLKLSDFCFYFFC